MLLTEDKTGTYGRQQKVSTPKTKPDIAQFYLIRRGELSNASSASSAVVCIGNSDSYPIQTRIDLKKSTIVTTSYQSSRIILNPRASVKPAILLTIGTPAGT